jgi:spermidine synthase
MNTYTEKQPWGTTSYTIRPGSYTSFQTTRAKVDLITNSHFGRMLFIDNVLQSSTADEHIYHKAIVKSAMGFRPNTRILVAGGAEGATVREIQNLDSASNLGVKEIIMVDWDEQLVKYMMNNEPWAQGSFDDPRLSLRFDDFEHYIESCSCRFDTIILDLLDPTSEEELQWLRKQIFTSSLALEPNGRLTVNCGNNIHYVENIKQFVQKSIRCSSVKVESIFVPSFLEVWYLLTLEKGY